MNSILSLIIVPFKLPDWVNFNEDRIMHNKHKFLKHILKRYYKTRHWYHLSNYPVMAEIILKNQYRIDASVYANPSPLLTKLIIETFTPLYHKLRYLILNTNPELADFIISHKSKFKSGQWVDIFRNPNPGLTEFIKEHYTIKYRRLLIVNTNPELAEMILSEIHGSEHFSKEEVSRNSNPGLTNYLQTVGSSNCNTNPELASIIIKNHDDIKVIYQNSNVGLTDFILSNPPKSQTLWNALAANANPPRESAERSALASNTNPKLEKFIYDNRDKIEIGSRHYLASNRYIFKKI